MATTVDRSRSGDTVRPRDPVRSGIRSSPLRVPAIPSGRSARVPEIALGILLIGSSPSAPSCGRRRAPRRNSSSYSVTTSRAGRSSPIATCARSTSIGVPGSTCSGGRIGPRSSGRSHSSTCRRTPLWHRRWWVPSRRPTPPTVSSDSGSIPATTPWPIFVAHRSAN